MQSYLDRLDWGLVSCAELLPDVDVLLGDILGEIDTLAAAAGVAASTQSTEPALRRLRLLPGRQGPPPAEACRHVPCRPWTQQNAPLSLTAGPSSFLERAWPSAAGGQTSA